MAISPWKEISAYETLWRKEDGRSFKTLIHLFKTQPDKLPSYFINESEEVKSYMRSILDSFKSNDYNFNVLVKGTLDYPQKLNNEYANDVGILYYSGDLSFLNTKSLAIVGTRNPSEEGLKRTENLVRLLVELDFTIISGLAKGIDTKAHKTAIKSNGRTIAVIGTPLNQFYPPENESIQRYIAQNHLLVSQIPFYRYSQQSIVGNRLFFPERNKTMSALSEGTVIIEAGETSGTLVQARAALSQGRKLFILESNFHKPGLTWPAKFAKQGAIRVKNIEDIIDVLK